MALRDILLGPPDEVHFTNLRPPKRTYCGPGIGSVLQNPDGTVILDSMQVARYVGYEEEHHPEPVNITPLADGRYLVSPVQDKVY